MAEHDYDELKHKTVAELREIAAEIDHPAVTGVTQMRKADVINAICEALNIEQVVHHDIVGVDKKAIKAKIAELKKVRDAALEARDGAELKKARRQIHRLKRNMRRHMAN